MEYTADVVASGIYFGEGPRWHDGELWFSDFFAHQIKAVDAAGMIRVVHNFPGQPSGLGWLPDGTLVASSMLDRSIKACRNGSWDTYADLRGIATYHTNDLVVNANGDIYIGNFGFDLDAEVELRGFDAVLGDHATATLALVKPDGSVHAVADGLHFPNGMVITPDGSTLIVAETAGFQLRAFTINADGTLGDGRVWAKTPGLPDGICLDAEGGVWIASAATPSCLRIEEGGEVTDQVTTPMPSYACMLGGDDGRDLYVMTAPAHDAHAAAAAPSGAVVRARVAVPRAGRP